MQREEYVSKSLPTLTKTVKIPHGRVCGSLAFGGTIQSINQDYVILVWHQMIENYLNIPNGSG